MRGRIKSLLQVFLPIFIAQAALTSTGFFDTVMSGQAGEEQLAGVAIGVNIWVPFFVGVLGIISGLTPIFAQVYGARRMDELPNLFMQGIYLSIVLALVILAAGYFVLDPVFAHMSLEAEVERVARGFLTAIAAGILPVFVLSVIRNYIDAQGFTRVTMGLTLICVPLNVFLCWLLVFGNWGAPVLGGIGAGVATAITYWIGMVLFGLVVHLFSPFRAQRVFHLPRPQFREWLNTLKLGLPIGGGIFAEMSAFSFVVLLIAKYGTAVIAANQAAINFSGLIYMIPLSIGTAMTILVGFEVGADRLSDARAYSRVGISVAVGISLITSVALFFGKSEVAAMYTAEDTLIPLIETFLAYAIFFQLSDAVAAPVQGALRGYKDVTVTMLAAIAAYWVVALPLGYCLAHSGWDAYGYWIGFIGGTSSSAILLIGRLLYLQKRKFKAG